jgi:hypothetical protein
MKGRKNRSRRSSEKNIDNLRRIVSGKILMCEVAFAEQTEELKY